MIRLFVLSLFLTSGLHMIQAQVSSQLKSHSLGSHPATVLQIPNAEVKMVGKVWISYMKDFYDTKIKYNRKLKEYQAMKADIVALGRGHDFDLYTTIEESAGGALVNVWVDLGESYLSEANHPEQYTETEKLLLRFSLEVAKELIREEIVLEEKELKNLNKTLEKLQRDKERYHSEIERARETIARAEKDIEKNMKEQEAAQAGIEAQQGVIEAVRKRLDEID